MVICGRTFKVLLCIEGLLTMMSIVILILLSTSELSGMSSMKNTYTSKIDVDKIITVTLIRRDNRYDLMERSLSRIKQNIDRMDERIKLHTKNEERNLHVIYNDRGNRIK